MRARTGLAGGPAPGWAGLGRALGRGSPDGRGACWAAIGRGILRRERRLPAGEEPKALRLAPVEVEREWNVDGTMIPFERNGGHERWDPRRQRASLDARLGGRMGS